MPMNAEITPITQDLLINCLRYDVTDLHLVQGEYPVCRRARMIIMPPKEEREQQRQLLDQHWDTVRSDIIHLGEMDAVNGALDRLRPNDGSLFLAFTLHRMFVDAQGKRVNKHKRVRVSFYRTRGREAFCLRFLPEEPPAYQELGIPVQIMQILTNAEPGLVLVSGEPCSGKSTTVAATIRYFNERHQYHIRTFECPIEYIHRSNQSLVTQQLVDEPSGHSRVASAADVGSYARALEEALLHDVNVIVYGEVKDLPTLKSMIKAANLNMLVFGTIHTESVSSTINRVIEDYPPSDREEARRSLARCLKAVICQRLRPVGDKIAYGADAATWKDVGFGAIDRDLVSEGKIRQIEEIVNASRESASGKNGAFCKGVDGAQDWSKPLSGGNELETAKVAC
jgi:twitching motility protein PilT